MAKDVNPVWIRREPCDSCESWFVDNLMGGGSSPKFVLRPPWKEGYSIAVSQIAAIAPPV